MEDVFEDLDEVVEWFNIVLYMVYDCVEEDIEIECLEKLLVYIWLIWYQDDNLLYVNDDDLFDWVDYFLVIWDDVDNLD